MNRVRGKCVFNTDLAKKYPFLRKDLRKSASDVKCDMCRSEFNIANKGRAAIEQHILTKQHQNAMESVSKTNTVKTMFTKDVDYLLAAREGLWAYHTIQSNQSFRSADCSATLLRNCFNIGNFRCARTKCEAIATNVLAPYAENVLKNELSERHYICLSTDASNHGNIKMMPVIVRMFIPTVGIKVKLLEFSTEKGETSEIISTLLIDTAKKHQIVNKIVGFCADNCPTNFGSREHRGDGNVYHHLKKIIPELFGIGCCAHIAHNTLKHSCDCLPIDLECVIVKIYNYFKINTVRVEALKSICELSDFEYSKILGYAKARFLALGPAIGSILKVYEPLKDYFLNLRRCPQTIKTFFESPLSKFWLLFVKDQVCVCVCSIISYPLHDIHLTVICLSSRRNYSKQRY